MFEQIFQRAIRIVKFDVAVYNEIEKDEGATQEAWLIVIITSLLAAIGAGVAVTAIPRGRRVILWHFCGKPHIRYRGLAALVSSDLAHWHTAVPGTGYLLGTGSHPRLCQRPQDPGPFGDRSLPGGDCRYRRRCAVPHCRVFRRS